MGLGGSIPTTVSFDIRNNLPVSHTVLHRLLKWMLRGHRHSNAYTGVSHGDSLLP